MVRLYDLIRHLSVPLLLLILYTTFHYKLYEQLTRIYDEILNFLAKNNAYIAGITKEYNWQRNQQTIA